MKVGKIRLWIAERFGLIDAFERIEAIESKQAERYPHLIEQIELLAKDSHPDRKEEFDKEINAMQDTIKRHENNLMHLQKNVQALKMEADIINKKINKK